eukprot:6120390-Amphidinium_carterae.2
MPRWLSAASERGRRCQPAAVQQKSLDTTRLAARSNLQLYRAMYVNICSSKSILDQADLVLQQLWNHVFDPLLREEERQPVLSLLKDLVEGVQELLTTTNLCESSPWTAMLFANASLVSCCSNITYA